MRVLVTGAAGQIGAAVVAHLVGNGYDVVATDIVYGTHLPVRPHVADLLDRNAIYPLLEGCDALVHFGNHANQFTCAPMQRLFSENVAMSANVIQAAVETGVRRILFSSSIQAACSRRAVMHHGATWPLPPSLLATLPHDTTTPVLPGNHYALSKAAIEQLMEMSAFDHPEVSFTAVRFPAVFSPHHRHFHRLAGVMGFMFVDEAFSYLALDDTGPLVDHILRAALPGFKALMVSANDNKLGFTAAEMRRFFFPDVPLHKPIDGPSPTLFDLGELHRLYGWAPRHKMQRPAIPDSMLEQAAAEFNLPADLVETIRAASRRA